MNTIVWRFIVFPGHEYCHLTQEASSWIFDGASIFSYEHKPCRLNYRVRCDTAWRTLEASVEGWVGQERIDVHARVGHDLRWWLNDVEVPEVSGCIDLDLNFSPCTNSLPIRRLNLAVGESAQVRAAWLRFPGFSLEPLEQRYTRLEERLYRYESGGGQFKADLRVDPSGLVTDYPGIWTAEARL